MDQVGTLSLLNAMRLGVAKYDDTLRHALITYMGPNNFYLDVKVGIHRYSLQCNALKMFKIVRELNIALDKGWRPIL